MSTSWRGTVSSNGGNAITRLFLLCAPLALGACATTKPAAYTGISSASQLSPNRDDRSGRIPYSYASDTEWRRYRKLILEPVVVYRGPDAQFGKIPERGKQALAGYMQQQFTDKLRPQFELVAKPAPDTLRIRLTLTGAKASVPVAATFGHFDLAGGPYNAVQAMRGKEAALTGSVFYVVEIFDASTSRLLAAQIVKQYPSAMNIKASFGALGASKSGIRNGAEALAKQLRGETNDS